MSTPVPLMPTTPPVPAAPSPGEIASWNNRRSIARQQYANQLASQQFARQQAGLSRESAMQNWQNQTAAGRSALPTSYSQRGLFRSGIFQRGLRDFYLNRLNAQQGIQTDYAQAYGATQAAEANAANTLAQVLAQIDTEEQARRAALAAEIRGVM